MLAILFALYRPYINNKPKNEKVKAKSYFSSEKQ